MNRPVTALVMLFVASSAVAQAPGVPPGPPTQKVNVVNTPLEVSVVTGAREPFQVGAQNIDPNPQSQSVEIFVVPAGKRLIIEYVGWQATVDAGNIGKARLSTTAGGTFASHRLGAQAIGNPSSGGGLIVEDGKVVKLFADPESTVRGQVFSGGTVENVIFVISGFLEDVD